MTRSLCCALQRSGLRGLLCGAAAGLAMALAGCPAGDTLPEARFEAAPNGGFVPLTVQFSDASLPGASPIRAWQWSFGDGTFSSARNPRHTYLLPGEYRPRLTVYTARGEDTAELERPIAVRATSNFGTLGPEGGTASPAGLALSVAAGALEAETVFGVNLSDAPFVTVTDEPVAPVSPTYTVFHNGASERVYALGADGAAIGAGLTFPFRADALPAEDRNGAKVQVLCRLEDGLVLPIPGAVGESSIRVTITHLPHRAAYAVVYRPEAESTRRTVAPPEGGPAFGAGWGGALSFSHSPALLAELTALRVGSIAQPAAYARRDWTPADRDASLQGMIAAVETEFLRLAGSGLRAPVLAQLDGAYPVLLFDMNPSPSADYGRFEDLVYRAARFGSIVIDPSLLVAIATRNAADFRDGAVDAGQELEFSGAVAQSLFESSFEAYGYPNLTAPAVALGGAAGDGTPVFFLQGLRDAVSLFSGQAAPPLAAPPAKDGEEAVAPARGLAEGDYLRLSEPLFFPYVAGLPGYSASGHEFFLYVARQYAPEPPRAYLHADAPVAGLLEAVRAALAAADPEDLDFATGLFAAAKAVDGVFEAFLGEPLAAAYWDFARARAVENTPEAQLRPSDAERSANRLIEERFDANAVAEIRLEAPTDIAEASAAELPGLAGIEPLSARAVVIKVNPLATELELRFNRAAWETDERGNGMAVAVYKQGEAAAELGPEDDTVLLTNFAEDPDGCYATVVVLAANLNLDAPNSLSVEAESFAALNVPAGDVLDAYLAACDPAAGYDALASSAVPGEDLTAYQLEVTSGAWRGGADVAPEDEVWRHGVLVIEPPAVQSSTALLVIGGGSTGEIGLEFAEPLVRFVKASGAVAAVVQAVPNQPVVFNDETVARSEDAILAYSYDKFMDGFAEGKADMTWPALLPMTRAAVRTMDAIQDFLGSKPGRPIGIDRFVVAGASKRGWTTWLTAAGDPRVSAIMPLVIDVLDMERQIEHHFSAYGLFSDALQDYVDSDIFCRFGTPAADALLGIVDPFTYRTRYTMPKLIANSTGDQFFLPDAARFYFNALPGEKHLYYAPNTDHSLTGAGFEFDEGTLDALEAFFVSQVRNTNANPNDNFVRPDLRYSFGSDGCAATVTINTARPARKATLWYANNPSGRDFRLETLGPDWVSEPLIADEGDPLRYVARIALPGSGDACDEELDGVPGARSGWNAYFVQVEYDGPTGLTDAPYTVSTRLNVAPDTYPVNPPAPIPGCTGTGL